jgi:antitoxin CptB
MMSELGKLRWRCRRGMKELDDLLTGYLQRHYPGADAREQQIFAELLQLQDPQLLAYLTGRETPADTAVAAVIEKIASVRH